MTMNRPRPSQMAERKKTPSPVEREGSNTMSIENRKHAYPYFEPKSQETFMKQN